MVRRAKCCVVPAQCRRPTSIRIKEDYLLAAAMLRLAIADWRAGIGMPEWSPRGKRSAEAFDWLFNDERRAHVTFQRVCDLLGAEPSWLRTEIRAVHGVSNGD
jgi:hypothetical protein